MNVEEATLVWEAVGAIGSIAGAAVSAGAAVFAVRLAQQERRDRLVERADRIAAEKRLRMAEEAGIRAQANRVVVRVSSGMPSPIKTGYSIVSEDDDGIPQVATRWLVTVRNGSGDPVRNVVLMVSPEKHPTIVDQVDVADVIAADKKIQTESSPNRAEIVQARPAFRLRFDDAAARTWETDQDGVLRQI